MTCSWYSPAGALRRRNAPSSRVIPKLINVESDETVTYRIVGEDEADVKNNLISVGSPIARALIGKEEGDVVTVKAPGGDIEYEIDQVLHV